MAEGLRQDRGGAARGAGALRRSGRLSAEPPPGYLGELARRLRAALGDQLAALWLAGSAALGAYEPGRSDLDVVGAVCGPLTPAARERAIAAAAHESLPCPARKLELVLHRRDALRSGEPGVELNLETGAGGTAAPAVGDFWFVVDLSVLRAAGRALSGPAPALLVAEPRQERLLAALRASLEWHAGPGVPPDDAVLVACRCHAFLCEGRWFSKRQAGEWAAAGGHAPPEVVRAALALRDRKDAPRPASGEVAALLGRAYRAVASRSASSRSGRRNA